MQDFLMGCGPPCWISFGYLISPVCYKLTYVSSGLMYTVKPDWTVTVLTAPFNQAVHTLTSRLGDYISRMEAAYF